MRHAAVALFILVAGCVYFGVTGGDPVHPLNLGASDPKAALLLNFVTNAAQTLSQSTGGGGTTPPPPNASPFDYNVFQTQIQPILDTAAGNGGTGCGNPN